MFSLLCCVEVLKTYYKMGKGGKEKQKNDEEMMAADIASDLEEDYDEDDPRSTEQFGLGYQATMVCHY